MPPKKSNLKKPGNPGRGQPRPRGQQPSHGQQASDPYNQQVRHLCPKDWILFLFLEYTTRSNSNNESASKSW